MKKILVTGGTGFIGAALVKRLVDEGNEVRVLDNNTRGSIDKLGEYYNKIEFIEGDVRDDRVVDNAANGINVLFHLAAVNGTRYFYEHPSRVLEVSLKGALNTLDSVIKHKIEKYIIASSSEVYQQPTTIPTPETERLIIPDVMNERYSYAGGKIISELLAMNYAKSYGFETIIFRPHNIYGPDMGNEHVIPELIQKIKIASNNFCKNNVQISIQGTGQETRAFCYIDDFVDGLMACYKYGESNEIYNIGDDTREISIMDLLLIIGDIMGINVFISHADIRVGGTTRRCPDIRKIRNLGFQPSTTLTDGLTQTIDWYKNH